jgi:hypothetical protein
LKHTTLNIYWNELCSEINCRENWKTRLMTNTPESLYYSYNSNLVYFYLYQQKHRNLNKCKYFFSLPCRRYLEYVMQHCVTLIHKNVNFLTVSAIVMQTQHLHIHINVQSYCFLKYFVILHISKWHCKIRGFHGSDYEECRLLGCYAVWLL